VGVLVHKKGDRALGHAAVPFKGRVSVAGEAVLVGGTCVIKHTPLLVGLVTIHAGRDLMGLLFPEPTLDNLDVYGLDPSVTGGAGGGHVVVVDTRARVGVGKDVVGGVA
jgi:hypothetical protein